MHYRLGGDIELGEIGPVLSKFTDVGCVDGGVAIMGEIPVATVIEKKQNDIGRSAASRP